ncbi:major facilitator superfamily domain-containing protein [Zychaea mexicana]|uniref:major facilitator superfamily domain-containing protein n=1 Tax=Zychaea mexicana TaxID=64656 RepID=UPI0022FF03B6|nr:major facilitator superfamily domain-containing protein [Zychaea mexicana]KAI9495322.1 major facilitator superfamily domain-containing protein [Zychaea mexicana]
MVEKVHQNIEQKHVDDIDDATVHHQEINVTQQQQQQVVVDRDENGENHYHHSHERITMMDQQSPSDDGHNSINDIWSITTCNKENEKNIQLEKEDEVVKDNKNGSTQTATRWKRLRDLVARDETIDPRHFPASKKRLIMIQMMFAAIVTPLSTTISFPALPAMREDLETTETAINAATTSIFVFFNASVPIIWASYSDVYGRRRVYLISILIAVIGNVCCALSINIAMLIVFRIMSAVGSCSILTVGTGILSDIYGPGERGKAYSWFVSAPLVVPAIAPVIGGYLTEGLGWRSTFALVAIYAFCIWIVMVFALPESLRRPEIFDLPTTTATMTTLTTEKKSIEEQPAKSNGAVNTTAIYGFSAGIVGLCYLPGALGGIAGSGIAGSISDKLYASDVAKGRKAYPERRLHYPLFGASVAVLVVSIVVYGWCTGMNVHFAVGLVALFFAFASLIIPSIILTVYLVECYPRFSASAAACNNLIRFCMGGVGALVASDLQRVMGNGPLLSACAGLIFLGLGLVVWTKQGRARWTSTRELNSNNNTTGTH